MLQLFGDFFRNISKIKSGMMLNVIQIKQFQNVK